MLYFLKETVKNHEWHIYVTPSYVDVFLKRRRNNKITTYLEYRHFVLGSGKDILICIVV